MLERVADVLREPDRWRRRPMSAAACADLFAGFLRCRRALKRLDMRGAPRPARSVHAERRPTCWTLVRVARRSRRRSASTRSSAPTPARTRRAPPTCCCITCFGEVNGKTRRVGPRHRRHGRDHAGDGGGGRARGVEIDIECNGRASRRGRPRRRRASSGRHRDRGAGVVANVNPQAAVPASWSTPALPSRFPRAHRALSSAARRPSA